MLYADEKQKFRVSHVAAPFIRPMMTMMVMVMMVLTVNGAVTMLIVIILATLLLMYIHTYLASC